MKASFLTAVFIWVCLSLIASESYACKTPPTARIVSPDYDPHYVCVGGSVLFNGIGSPTAQTGSYDHDNGSPYGGGHGITAYEWDFGDGYTDTEGITLHTYLTASGIHGSRVTLEVTDDDDPSQTSTEASCTVYVVGVGLVTEDKTIACVYETITFTAEPNPISCPLDCIEWQKRYRENSAASWGGWETASGGDNTAVLDTDTPGFYQYRARNGSGDTWKTSSEVTVVGVEITENPGWVLVYTGSEAGNEPTKTATAVGTPSGWEYSWSREQHDSGDIEFVSGQTSSTVTIRGTAPSDYEGNVELIVTYDGCVDSVGLTVRRMSSTTCHWGALDQDAFRTTRFFYHRIKDQFTEIINETGIPCDENLRWKEGAQPPREQSAPTLLHSSDGDWPGGIAVKDIVGCPNSAPKTNIGQDIIAGGWSTSPAYDIWMDIYEGNEIWKEIEQ